MPSRTSAAPVESRLNTWQALLLGAVQGPAELLPVSSSAHTSVIPWLLGWPYDDLEPEVRKSFEVALHAGTALALFVPSRRRSFDPQAVRLVALAALPPAVAGSGLEGPIEQRLGSPITIAVGLLAGSAAMALADRCPRQRRRAEAGLRDGLWIGLAQAVALIPGVSRAGATRSAARWLRFHRADARLLSDEVALPVLAGAGLLKAIRLARQGLEPQLAPTFAVGAAASFASTVLCAQSRRRHPAASERLLPYAVYRAGLAVLLLMRLRRTSIASRRAPAPG